MIDRERKAIVGYSFGYRILGGKIVPGLSNEALARIIYGIKTYDTRALVVTQWEITEALKRHRVYPDLTIREHRRAGQYLDSEEVTMQAAKYLHEQGVTTVHLVAQPFLHSGRCAKLLKAQGFKVEIDETPVPFDPESAQWWTRGLMKLLWYGIRQKCFGIKGR